MCRRYRYRRGWDSCYLPLTTYYSSLAVALTKPNIDKAKDENAVYKVSNC
jgi:hypothetical protein